MTKVIVYQMYSEARIELVKETNRHPPLIYMLQQLPIDVTWEEQLAEIAGYCFIVVDGMYMPKDLEGLYDKLIKSLRKSRTSKLILPGNNIIQ